MNLPNFRWRTLSARITLATLCIFLVSIWSLALYATHALRKDMRHLIGQQQFATATILAASVNDGLAKRLHALDIFAGTVAAEVQGTSGLQRLLARSPLVLELFNGGIVILNRDGTAIAGTSAAVGRIGVNLMDRVHVAAALRDGKATIGPPGMSEGGHAAMFGMAVPVRDAIGRVTGAVLGMTELSKPNFIDRIAGNAYGRTGAYVVVAPHDRLVIAASDRSRIMETLPVRGANPSIDRFIDGFEGPAVIRNAAGGEVLAAAKTIPLSGWFAAVTLPIENGFAPIRAVQRRVLVAAFLLSLLAAGLTWMFLKRQLAPILDTVRTLAAFSDLEQFPQPLPVVRQDELGELIGGFNRLLETLSQRDRALRENEHKLATILQSVDACIYMKDRSGRYVFANRKVCELFGVTEEEIVGSGDEKFFDAATVERIRVGDAQVLEKGISFRTEETTRNCKDGCTSTYLTFKLPLRDESGEIYALCGISTDITERKLAEDRLRLAASVFTHAYEGIALTTATGAIIDVNDAFCRITGYSREEVLGGNPRLLKSGRHDDAFYAALWQRLAESGCWQGEMWNRRKNGEIYPELKTISAVRDEHGEVRHYVALSSDITERKSMEEQIRQLAFFDPLTSLPNRRLFQDRMRQALAARKRTGREGALLFIDLDNFKPLNDTHGHDVGDLLLVEVARRLQKCVRELDTVARFGGDEFVVMLGDLHPDRVESRHEAERVAQKILARLSDPYVLTIEHAGQRARTVRHRCTASIGVAMFLDSEASEELILKRADAAMYRAKEAGRGAIRIVASSDASGRAEAEAAR